MPCQIILRLMVKHPLNKRDEFNTLEIGMRDDQKLDFVQLSILLIDQLRQFFTLWYCSCIFYNVPIKDLCVTLLKACVGEEGIGETLNQMGCLL